MAAHGRPNTPADKSDLPLVTCSYVPISYERGGEKEGLVCTYYLGTGGGLNYELVGPLCVGSTSYCPPAPGIKPNGTFGRYVRRMCTLTIAAAFEREPIERDSAADNAPGLLDGSVGHAEIVHRGCVLLYAGLV